MTVAHKAVFRINADHHENGVVDTEYQTDDYIVGIGYPDFNSEINGRLMYMVVNKNTGVVEFTDPMLPNAVTVMRKVQEGLDALQVRQ